MFDVWFSETLDLTNILLLTNIAVTVAITFTLLRILKHIEKHIEAIEGKDTSKKDTP